MELNYTNANVCAENEQRNPNVVETTDELKKADTKVIDAATPNHRSAQKDWRLPRMSVLIRGAKMPERCTECPLFAYNEKIRWMDGGRYTEGAYCCIMTGRLINNIRREERCPLVEIPPHGRLIDADKLKPYRLNEHYRHRRVYDAEEVENAPTIIPADEAEQCGGNTE